MAFRLNLVLYFSCWRHTLVDFAQAKWGKIKYLAKIGGFWKGFAQRRLLNYLLPVLQLGVGGSKASFTPFVDPRVYQTSPGENDDNSAAGKKYLKARVRRTAVQM